MATSFFVIVVLLCCFFFALWIVERIKLENLREKTSRLISGHDQVVAKGALLTKNEIQFFHDLQKKFGVAYFIFTQVSLSALLQIKEDQMDRYERRNLMDKFFVDFVLCNKETFKPELVIELNDKTHFMNNRKERDAYVTEMLKAANIKLYPCPAGHLTYEHFMKEIEEKLNKAI